MLLKKLQDRYTVTIIAFLTVFIIIVSRLAGIMIVEGEAYREEAENRIYKSIPLTAPRGEIRDRYGRLLAGNRPSYTVQIMKNEIVDSEINQVALRLIEIFHANGDAYVDEFPIVIDEEGKYAFTYDQSIASWQEANQIPLGTSGTETYQLLFERYGIDGEDPVEAQQQLLQYMTVPVSIISWNYTDYAKKVSWLSTHGITDVEIPAEEAFNQVREKYYKVPDTYTAGQARQIMVIREQLNKMGYLQFQPVKIAQDVSELTVIKIEENILDLPGVNIEVEPIRYYPEGNTAAHVLGTLGKISQQAEIDYYVKELQYNQSDIIGKTGVEESFEETLKGSNGSQKVIVDSRGRLIEVLEREEPTPGDTVYLTLDLNLQQKAEAVVAEVLPILQQGGTYTTPWGSNRLPSSTSGPMSNATSASVVITDVNTGELLALVNYPDYDPNKFATGISTTDWNSLMPENERDPLAPRPLTNIAMSTAIQPGSTYKMLVGIAALEQGLSPLYSIVDRGFIQIGGHSFGNWLYNQGGGTMGRQNLHEAIAQSNNFYFYSLGTGYDHGIGRYLPISMDVNTIIDYSKRFGLNDRTGLEIDVPRERSGGVPSLESKTRTIKALLKRYLERQLTPDDFQIEPLPDKAAIDEMIETILSWTEENPSRGQVYARLLEMGIREDRTNLYTDVIKYNYFMQARWSTADTMNFSIGQGEHSYTPLQMANFMAIMANGGYRYRVTLLDRIQSYDGTLVEKNEPELIERVAMNNYDNLDEVTYGMHLVTTTGSARSYFSQFPVKVAGKTGTAQRSGKIPPVDEVAYLLSHLRQFGVTEEAVYAEMARLKEEDPDNISYDDEGTLMATAIKSLNPKIKTADIDQYKDDYDNYAWFTGFAPYENPEIAISVLVFQGGSGGYASVIFREIAAEYLGLNIEDDSNQILMTNQLTR